MSGERSLAYQPALDGLRAFAVLSVVCYHLGYDWAGGGFLGVDAFFVLSGYLITTLLLTERSRSRRIDLPGFWARRARRLLPAVLVLVAVLALYAVTWAPPERLDTLRGDGLATLGYVANWRLVLSEQSYFDLFSAPSPLRHMWSLAIEEQFYVVWPLLTAGALALVGGRRRALAVLCGAGAVASAVMMALRYDAADPSRSYYGTDTRAHVILVGALLALVLHYRGGPRSAAGRAGLQAAGLAGAAALLLAVRLVGDRDAFMYRGGFLAYSVVVAAVIAAAVQSTTSPVRSLLSPAPVRWVGQVSYGLYLWHWPVIVVLNRGRVGVDGLALDAVRLGATFAVTAVSYYVIERPIRYGRLTARAALSFAPVGLVVTGAVLVVATAGGEPLPVHLRTDAPITAPPPSTAPVVTTTTTPAGPGSVSTSPGATTSTVPPRPARLAVVGDSVATTVFWGLEDAAAGQGMSVVLGAFPGCGVASGFPVDGNGRPFDWSDECARETPKTHEALVRDHDPDLIVWLSTWELSDRVEDGEVLEYGTAEHDAALARAFGEATDRLTAGGGRVVLLTLVPKAPSDTAAAEDDGDGRYAHYNSLLREFADTRPDDVSLVDLAPLICPGGPPCPEEVEGVRLRPDGGHFTEETSPWLAERLLPLLLDAYAG